MAILSIQSHVAFGHVGNAAAVPLLQALGHEVWPLHSVQFSAHKGYPQARGQAFPPAHIADLVQGLADMAVLGDCAALLSGYLGSPALGEVVLKAVDLVKAANPAALYICDPVLGDDGQIYVDPALPAFFQAKALKRADIILPNLFELECLTGARITGLESALAAAQVLQNMGPSLVVVTSVEGQGITPGHIGVLALGGDQALLVEAPRLDLHPRLKGLGDSLAALLSGHLLSDQDLASALALSVSSLDRLLQVATKENLHELPLIAALASLRATPAHLVLRAL